MRTGTLSDKDSQTISRLRLPLAVGVVFIHLNMGVNGNGIHWSDFGSMDFYRLSACVLINELASLAVPLFFVISGFLFFRNTDLTASHTPLFRQYTTKLKSRARSLLLPYLVFNILAILGLIISKLSEGCTISQATEAWLGGTKWLHDFWDIHQTGTSVNILGISKTTAYPINIPLWFMRDLMVLVVMSPLIYYAIRWMRWGWLILMTALTLTGIWLPWPGFGVTCCLFFSIGAWFALTKRSLALWLNPRRWWLAVLTVTLMCCDVFFDGTAPDKYIHIAFLTTGVLTVYAFAQRLHCPAPSWAGQASFFVFATHTLPLAGLGIRPVEWCKDLIWTNSTNGFACTLQFIVAGLLTATVCLVAFLILNKICPRFVNFVTGRK